MKRNILFAIILTVAVALAGLAIYSVCADKVERSNNLYPMTAKVFAVNTEYDFVCIESDDGNIWEFDGSEGFSVGDCVSVIMDSKGTESIYDDEIVTVEISAWEITR